MSAPSFNTALAQAGTDALWRTNPVLCIDRLLVEWNKSDSSCAAGPGRLSNIISTLSDSGISLPSKALNRWASSGYILGPTRSGERMGHLMPRIVGLAVDALQGYIYPLRPQIVKNGWEIDSGLPFTSNQIQHGLARLLKESGMPDLRAVPERLAFRFENPTGLSAVGISMTVAAILAVLDQMGGHTSSLFRAAVALVELQPGGRLGAVDDIPMKLQAAYRECGDLSLIVCPPGIEIDRSSQTEVWEVRSLRDLAKQLHAKELLEPLLTAIGPFSKTEAARVLDLLRSLVEREHDYAAAADLGDRVRRCGISNAPEPALWVEFARMHGLACRHNGRFEDAVSVGCKAYEQVANLGDMGCDDEEGEAAAEYAASLFSGHRFADIPPLLQVWADACFRKPRRFRPLTRVKIWNTLGRALSVLKHFGWDELFGHSLVIHRAFGDFENIARTTHYRAHAWLRHGNVSGACKSLAEVPELSESAGLGNPWAAFLRANIARFENREWSDPVLEQKLSEDRCPYPAWLYPQAAARQKARKDEDSVRRLQQAVMLLRGEADGMEGNICNLFATFLELNAAARSMDQAEWHTAIAGIQRFLCGAPDHNRYYGPSVDVLPTTPDLVSAEALLDLVPYF